MKYITRSTEETVSLGEKFAKLLHEQKVFALHGDLGSGKTTFTQGIAKGLGINRHTTSPTYIIMRTYDIPETSKKLYHIDLYRTGSIHDVEGIGLLDLIQEDDGIFVIEWPEKIQELLPKETVHFYFSYSDDINHVIEVNESENNIDNSWYEKPNDDYPVRITAGGVVVRKENDNFLVALVHEGAFDSVVLPKGGVDDGESIEEGAKREIAEEAGITKMISLGKLGICERFNLRKTVWTKQHFFLFVTEQVETNPTETDHVYKTEWYDIDHLPKMFWREQKELVEEKRQEIKELVTSYYER